MPRLNKYDRSHLAHLSAYQRQVDAIYAEAAKEAAKLAAQISDFNASAAFSFVDYPMTRKRCDALLERLKSRLYGVIANGIRSEWTLANNKNDELSRQVFGVNVGRLSQAQYRRYFSTNGAARDAFIARRDAGMNLSDRVWNYTSQFRAEMEQVCDIGIRNGMSAEEMQRELQQYLKHPDNFFRRFRYKEGVDENGNPLYGRKWKKRYWDEMTGGYRWEDVNLNDPKYHYGRGVYRSSYKNARRLAVTETNIAYRTADHLRWQQMDFVVGIHIEPSNTNHPVIDICDILAGDYPKDFKWTGWHPHCRCHATAILKTEEEMVEDNNRILQGEEPTEDSVNAVKECPAAFQEWVEDNSDKIIAARLRGKEPYFLADNVERVNGIMGSLRKVNAVSEETLAEYCDKHRTFDFMVHNQESFDEMQTWAIDSCGQHWLDASPETRQAIIDYTGNNHGRINRSLFALGENTPEGELIDKLLDKVELPQDMVLRRGTSYDELLSVFGQQFHDLAKAGDVDALNKLAGITGVNEAFISTSFNKLGGFQHAAVDLTIFAPKGTHAIFAQPFSAVEARRPEKWDGKTFVDRFIENRENEFIVHRGYTYRFVKAEVEPGLFKGGHTVKVWVELLTRDNRKVK